MIYHDNEDIRLITCANAPAVIQHHLNDCRQERRPYVFVTPTMREITCLQRILVPVTLLEEEVYKAQICTYLSRKTGATIVLMPAHDYGHKARTNMQRIISHILSIRQTSGDPIPYEILPAHKNSFALTREAVERQRESAHQLLLLTASREYGWDDILFGPPERRAIMRSQVPVMLVNPRADLFSLCD